MGHIIRSNPSRGGGRYDTRGGVGSLEKKTVILFTDLITSHLDPNGQRNRAPVDLAIQKTVSNYSMYRVCRGTSLADMLYHSTATLSPLDVGEWKRSHIGSRKDSYHVKGVTVAGQVKLRRSLLPVGDRVLAGNKFGG